MSRHSRKLTREELLAGKIQPDRPAPDPAVDPRIKSPDEVLMRMSPKFRPGVPDQTPETPAAAPLPQADPFAEEILRLRSELEQWQTRYNADIQKWINYDQRIQEWKGQVQEVFEGLRKEILMKREMEAELARVRQLLADKEHEIMRLRLSKQSDILPTKPNKPTF